MSRLHTGCMLTALHGRAAPLALRGADAEISHFFLPSSMSIVTVMRSEGAGVAKHGAEAEDHEQ